MTGLFDLALLAGAGVAVAAGLVRGLAGFGGALVMSPILSLLYGPAPAVAMTTSIELVGYLQLMPSTARQIRWREVAPMAAAALAALPVGVYLVVHVEPLLMRRIIGAVVAVLAAVLMLGWQASRAPGRAAGLGAAGVGGLLGGLAGTPGPPVVLFYYAGPDSSAANRLKLIGFFTLLDAVSVMLFAWHGAFAEGVWARALLLAPVSVAATWVGARLFRAANEKLLRWLALVLILLIGLAGLLI